MKKYRHLRGTLFDIERELRTRNSGADEAISEAMGNGQLKTVQSFLSEEGQPETPRDRGLARLDTIIPEDDGSVFNPLETNELFDLEANKSGIATLYITQAGSRDEMWKSRKDNPEKAKVIKDHRIEEGISSKRIERGMKVVMDISGPMGGIIAGTKNTGARSTLKNIEVIKSVIKKAIDQITEAKKGGSSIELEIKIKAHSRGAVAAAKALEQLATENKTLNVKDYIEVVLFDPVPGVLERGNKNTAPDQYDIDLNGFNATVLYSTRLEYGQAFTASIIRGAKRKIFVSANHDAGKTSYFLYNREIYYGHGMSQLLPGIYYTGERHITLDRLKERMPKEGEKLPISEKNPLFVLNKGNEEDIKEFCKREYVQPFKGGVKESIAEYFSAYEPALDKETIRYYREMGMNILGIPKTIIDSIADNYYYKQARQIRIGQYLELLEP